MLIRDHRHVHVAAVVRDVDAIPVDVPFMVDELSAHWHLSASGQLVEVVGDAVRAHAPIITIRPLRVPAVL